MTQSCISAGKKRGGRGMKDKQKKRGGGSNIEKPPENDIYIHPKHAQEIVKYLSPHFPIRLHYNVLDACCGHGVLGDAIKDYYSRKINSDVSITYQDIKINGKSILDEKYDKLFDIIICNPPWVPVDLPEAIYHYLIGLLNTGGVLIFIINNTFVYQGIDRAILLDYQK
jgi:2-polyprenyl-3-methyl-5-hydroxy-6-metoxy-1,4-benzoquinol methylase